VKGGVDRVAQEEPGVQTLFALQHFSLLTSLEEEVVVAVVVRVDALVQPELLLSF